MTAVRHLRGGRPKPVSGVFLSSVANKSTHYEMMCLDHVVVAAAAVVLFRGIPGRFMTFAAVAVEVAKCFFVFFSVGESFIGVGVLPLPAHVSPPGLLGPVSGVVGTGGGRRFSGCLFLS